MNTKYLIPFLALAVAGCATLPPTGSDVVVQLRRGDALAEKIEFSLSPLAPGANSAIKGRLVEVERNWVVLETEGEKIWIPKESVLLISQSK